MELLKKEIREKAKEWAKSNRDASEEGKKNAFHYVKKHIDWTAHMERMDEGELDIKKKALTYLLNQMKTKVLKQYQQTLTEEEKNSDWKTEYMSTAEYLKTLKNMYETDKDVLLIQSEAYAESPVFQETKNTEKGLLINHMTKEIKNAVKDALLTNKKNEANNERDLFEWLINPELLDKNNPVEDVWKAMNQYLTTGKVGKHYSNFTQSYESIIMFTERFRNNMICCNISQFMSETSFSALVRSKIVKKEDANWALKDKKKRARFDRYVEGKYGFKVAFANKVEETLTTEWILEKLSRNKRYREQVQKALYTYRLELVMEQNILKQIPEKYEDMYPMARTMKRHFILHIGPTNSGKTYDAMQAFRNADKGIYLAPLRLMAYESFEESNKKGCLCNMITGEEELLVPNATHTSCTIEMADYKGLYDVCVIDEAQMLGDSSRGGAWTAAMLGMRAETIHVCAAVSAKDILIKLINLCGDTYEVVEHKRAVPLVLDRGRFEFPESVRKHDALIVFSKRSVLQVAAELQAEGWKVSVIYGALPYESRQREVERFLNGETDVVVATDAIGMGMNLPVERIVFLEVEKFDGKQRRTLLEQEVKQIAGRAGRRGKFETGYYTAAYDVREVSALLREISKPIEYVYMPFPENLLTVEGKVSELLSKWANISSDDIFLKQEVLIEARLARVLEEYTEDKELIYDFITIPFEEDNQVLFEIWMKLFRSHTYSKEVSVYQYLNPYQDLKHMSLDNLELEYKKSDLLYNYYRKFGMDKNKESLMLYKKEISEQITEHLKKQKLPRKKCKTCGKELPWNYPYKECEDCYDRRRWTHYPMDDVYDDYYFEDEDDDVVEDEYWDEEDEYHDLEEYWNDDDV